MDRAWRRQADWLLATFMVLDVLILVYTRTAGAGLNVGQPISGQLFWLALDGFLAWRVWRHSRIAWAILLLLSGIVPLVILLAAAWPFPPYLLGLLALLVAQVALLLSPAVRGRVRN